MNTTMTPEANEPAKPSLSFDLESWLYDLVRAENPHWVHPNGFCPDCWSEVQKMLDESEQIEVV